MKPRAKLIWPILALMSLALLLGGCAATTTALRYKDLDVQTKMSNSIFLDPVAPAQRTIFIQVRNTSDKPFNVQSDIVGRLVAKGYKVVQDPSKATYILQANVLSVGMVDQSALEKSTMAGFGGVAVGAGVGALLGGSRAGAGAVVGGLAAGAAEAIAGSLTKVVTYAVITDVQISERTQGPVSEEFTSNLKQGSANTSVQQRTSSTTNRKEYQTRIASSARQVNLKFQEAYPHLRQGIVDSISGLF